MVAVLQCHCQCLLVEFESIDVLVNRWFYDLIMFDMFGYYLVDLLVVVVVAGTVAGSMDDPHRQCAVALNVVNS